MVALNKYIKSIDIMRGTDFTQDFAELYKIWSSMKFELELQNKKNETQLITCDIFAYWFDPD